MVHIVLRIIWQNFEKQLVAKRKDYRSEERDKAKHMELECESN